MELTVRGMTCGHFEAAVQRAVEQAAPQAEIEIDRAHRRVSIKGANDTENVSSAIREVGFEVSSIEWFRASLSHNTRYQKSRSSPNSAITEKTFAA